ncbi:tetratricopeptide repeat protein [Blautia sp. RD014234]|nr:tetratricopeptide repeat protein [Blautia parvula]
MVLEQLPEVARKKKKGDYLVDNRMYVNAIRIYEDALRSVDTGGLGGQYEGEIFHNMGCAYLHLFQIEEAKECFEKAYEKLHTKLILKHYLCACRMLMEEAQWQGECARMGADLDTCREIQKEMEAKKPDASREKQEDMGALLEKYTKEYHRSTGF